MARTYRYRLQPFSGPKSRSTCPNCEKAKQFVRWVDTSTDEQLPEQFGRCERKDKCGYSLSPYDLGPGGISYAEAQRTTIPFSSIGGRIRLAAKPTPPLSTIPEEILQQTMRRYERNVFAQLLQDHFGQGVAKDLLHRFEIGTSTHWEGATVFWQRDELGRVRGGQVVLFKPDGHTSKRLNANGEPMRCITWVHKAMAARYRKLGKTHPGWLLPFLNQVNPIPKSPSLYGLAQLAQVRAGQPVAIVEAPKTAVVCTAYQPEFTWFAVGALGYLNAERLSPLKSHPITLYPDASLNGGAYRQWQDTAKSLEKQGFVIQVSSLLEHHTTPDEQAAGSDLADFLLAQWAGYPPSWD